MRSRVVLSTSLTKSEQSNWQFFFFCFSKTYKSYVKMSFIKSFIFYFSRILATSQNCTFCYHFQAFLTPISPSSQSFGLKLADGSVFLLIDFLNYIQIVFIFTTWGSSRTFIVKMNKVLQESKSTSITHLNTNASLLQKYSFVAMLIYQIHQEMHSNCSRR